MPRPGPRPFECVRRSWHSDRHQAIRGSIIQQIFRAVHENHSPGTKKNREWQEKLPLVVFKSEEIMYSKANSEAEYIDPETLWDRLNDAIDTIIRKDEAMETGEFLPPCVEAALNLGCVPVKSSRSQRNSNPRSYLSPRNQPSDPDPRNFNVSNVQRPDVVDQTRPFSEANNKNIRSNFNITHPSSLQQLPRQMVSFENSSSSIYPLYYGFHFQPEVAHMGFRATQPNPDNIIVGMPVFQQAHGPLASSSQKAYSERLFSFDGDKSFSKKESRPELGECDLSLRLGLVSSDVKGLTCVDCDDEYESGGRNSENSLRSKEFSFFPLNSEAEEVHNLVTDDRKRKMVEESHSFVHLDRDYDQRNERMKRRRGL